MLDDRIKVFKAIDADEYVREGIVSGKLKVEEVRKLATIQARQGTVGEKIETVLASGFKEVKGVVSLDPMTGRPGWIARNPGGEEYIIPDSDFQMMYAPDPEHPGQFKKIVPALSVEVDENVVFTNKYGEEMRMEAGGHLIFFDGARGPLGKRTYGVAREAWDTYERTGRDDRDALRQAIQIYGITREEMEEARKPKTNNTRPSTSPKKDDPSID